EGAPEEYRRRRFALSVAGYVVDLRHAYAVTPFKVAARTADLVRASLGPGFDLRTELDAIDGARTLFLHGADDPLEARHARKLAVLVRIAEIAPPKDGKTLVTVEEKLGDRALTTIWTCTKEGLTVPADSFFFVGEPGGGPGATLVEKSHDGVTFPKGLEEGTA